MQNVAERVFVGVDIGGTKCAVTIGTDPEHIVAKHVVPTNLDIHPEHFLARLADDARELLNTNAGTGWEIERIGIVCGGPLDLEQGIICSPPNLPGWDRIPVVDIFSQRLGAFGTLQNDADACAVAEWRFGAGRGTDTMVFLTFGTGMGAGLIINSRLFRGTTLSAGEVGRIRLAAPDEAKGIDGTFEGFCSGNGIARRARARAYKKLEDSGKGPSYCPNAEAIPEVSTQSVAEAARCGDPAALEIFHETGEKLGAGLATILDMINPQKIVIGSIYSRCEDLLAPVTIETLRTLSLPKAFEACSIVPSYLDENVGDVAALSVSAGLLDRY